MTCSMFVDLHRWNYDGPVSKASFWPHSPARLWGFSDPAASLRVNRVLLEMQAGRPVSENRAGDHRKRRNPILEAIHPRTVGG